MGADHCLWQFGGILSIRCPLDGLIRSSGGKFVSVVGRTGLEPVTPWLKVMCWFYPNISNFHAQITPKTGSIFNESGAHFISRFFKSPALPKLSYRDDSFNCHTMVYKILVNKLYIDFKPSFYSWLTLSYSEHLSATWRACTLSCRSSILHGNTFRILHFLLWTAFHTVGLHLIYPLLSSLYQQYSIHEYNVNQNTSPISM